MTDQPLADGMMRDLQGNVVPIPQGATQEPITQPKAAQSQNDNMMTDLQGNRVPIPQGATQEPVQPGAASRFGSGVAAGAKSMVGDIPSLKDIAVEGAVGPAMQVIKAPIAAYKAYEQARDENQPVVSSLAAGAAGLVGVDAPGIRERAAKGDIAGIVGEAVPSIAMTLLGGEHERLGKVFESDARALQTANATHDAAKAQYGQRLMGQEVSTQQAIDLTKKARDLTDKLRSGDPNVTQQHVDDANTLASAATADSRKATQALNDAHNQRAEAAVQVDRLNRKIQGTTDKLTTRQTKNIVGANEDFKKAIPPSLTGKAAYTDKDYDITRGYLENHHQTVAPVDSVQGTFDALDHIQKDMEQKVAPYREKYSNEPIQTNVRMDVRDALAENPDTSFVQKGMQALEPFNLIDPTVGEAEAIRKKLNSDVRGTLQQTHWDVQTAVDTDPVFAAKYAALDSLRDGIYNTYEDKGVNGIRELRQDEASVIRVRNAAQRQLTKGDVRLRGSSGSGPWRKMLAKGAQTTLAGVGAAGGMATGIPGATEAGAMIGSHLGNKLGTVIAPWDLTRDAMIERSMKVEGGGVPVTNIEGKPLPATQFGPPQPVSPLMDLYTPQRENTPLHSELATHYNEDVNTSYLDLEKRFKDDIGDKKAHGVPLEPAEKTLLGKINLADASDRLKASQQAQKMAAEQKPVPRATIPEDFAPLLEAPKSKLAEGMDTRQGIVHDLAHIVVGDQRGIDFRDGVQSHLHPETSSAGAVMSAPIDWEPFLDDEGNVDPAKLKAKMADFAATYVAGGVANDLYHDVPYTENHHLGADVRVLKSFLKNTGFTEAEASKMIAQATDDAAQILSKPGVQSILESHAAVREEGLDDRYHISPERAELIKQDIQGAIDEHPTRNNAGPNAEGDRSGKATGAGAKNKLEDRNPEVVRQPSKGPDEGKGSDVGEVKPESKLEPKPAESEPRVINPEPPKLDQGGHAGGGVASEEELARPGRFVKIDRSGMPTDQNKVPDFNLKQGEAGYQVKPDGSYELKAGQETPATKRGVEGYAKEVFKPENPKFDVPAPKERSTGDPELDQRIRDAGGTPGGIMKGFDYTDKKTGQPARYPDTALVHHESGSSLNVPTDATPEYIRQQLDNKTAEYTAAAQRRAQPQIHPENPQLGKPELRVSTRVPSGKDATEDAMGDNRLEIDRAALEKTPIKLQQKFADKIREMPGVKIPKGITDIGKVYDRAISQLSDHLKWLYNEETPENRTNNAKWYESAHNMTKKWADNMGYKHEQVAGALASLSPQTEWDLNVSQAKRLIDIHKNHQDAVMGPNEMKTAQDIIDRSRQGKNKTANADLENMLDDIKGKKISDLTGLPRAAAVRLYDETYNPRTFNRIDPATGNEMEVRTNQNGQPTRAGWGNFSNMDKALSILDDGSRKNISDQVGDSHKVRNFYNNIIDPSHPRDVTMDTHAVGAATLTPMSGNTKEVTDNFGGAGSHAGTGVTGTYPLFADAYRKAAGELGIKARELQSVTWEKVRDMFPAEWKTEENMGKVHNEWKRYSDGKQSLADTRENILDMSNQGKKEAAERQAVADQKRQAKLNKPAKSNVPQAGLDALGGK